MSAEFLKIFWTKKCSKLPILWRLNFNIFFSILQVHSEQAHTNLSVPGPSSSTLNPPQQQPCSDPQITPMTSTVPPGVEDAGPPRVDDPAAGGSSSAQVAQASKNPMDLEQENQRLKEAQTCKICMDNQIGVVFLPCGHFICCVKCAPSLRDCPYCRQSIHGTVKTYMSWSENTKN